jgi:hypothetical protein
MIIKPKYYNYQNDDAIENYNKKTMGKNYYLETCGWNAVTTACNIVLGEPLKVTLPGGETIDPAMAAWIWCNTPENFEKLKKYRDNIDPNSNVVLSRVPQFFCATQELFGVYSEFHFNNSFDVLKNHIEMGRTLVICLRNPRHYLAAYDYNNVADYIICFDPNKKNNGKYDRIDRKTFGDNVQNYYNVFFPTKIINKFENKFRGFFGG